MAAKIFLGKEEDSHPCDTHVMQFLHQLCEYRTGGTKKTRKTKRKGPDKIPKD